MFHRDRRGVTLVELMMAVLILGVLISIIYPHYDLVLQNAYQSACKANIGAFKSAIGIYYTDNLGVYPLMGYPPGNIHYTTYGLSLKSILYPHISTRFQLHKSETAVPNSMISNNHLIMPPSIRWG